MKRKLAMLLCILLSATLLTACQQADEPQDVPISITQAILPAPTPTLPIAAGDSVIDENGNEIISDTYNENASIFAQNPYLDAVGFTEEDAIGEEDTEFEDTSVQEPRSEKVFTFDYSPASTVYPYAGSTPIPLNPVDMPTPTPHPPLEFTYTAYNAMMLGLTFEGPINWMSDESNYQVFVLNEPDLQKHDNFACQISVSAEPVTETYTQRNLTSYVKQRMSTINEAYLKSSSPSNTAERYMLGKKGVYMNYSGTLLDGTEVGGRILYVCIDKTLYGLEIMYPLAYREDYLNVFGQIRSTIKKAN